MTSRVGWPRQHHQIIHEDFQDISFNPLTSRGSRISCATAVPASILDGHVDDPVNGDIDTERFEERNEQGLR